MSPGPQHAAPYSVVALGPWSHLHLQQVPSRRRIDPAVESAIAQSWSQGLIRTPKLFDGPMCRLEMLTPLENSTLKIDVSLTSYKTFYGTNLYHPELRAAYGSEVMANPIGLSPALVTADNHLVFGRRNQTLAYYPGRIHPFSGALEPHEHPFAAVRRELAEELGLTDADLHPDIRLLGVVEDRRLIQPEFIFHVATTRTLTELRQSLDPDEHQGIASIRPDQPAACLALDGQPTPVALATIDLYQRLVAEPR